MSTGGITLTGSANAWNVGPCCVDNTDDVAFAKALVAEIETLACIDAKRVYAVGFSMGGGMSHYCAPSRPITVVSFRGTADPIVPYGGGASSVVSGHPVTFLGAVNTFKKWAEINGCTGLASDAGDGCQAYTQCMGGAELLLCGKQGGGHEAGNARIAWPVLKRHSLP